MSKGGHHGHHHSHDAVDSVDDALESSAQGIHAVKISLLVLGATALFQLVIVGLSGSIALAADTIHNFSDAVTAVPLWSPSCWAAAPPLNARLTGWDDPKTSPDCSCC